MSQVSRKGLSSRWFQLMLEEAGHCHGWPYSNVCPFCAEAGREMRSSEEKLIKSLNHICYYCPLCHVNCVIEGRRMLAFIKDWIYHEL